MWRRATSPRGTRAIRRRGGLVRRGRRRTATRGCRHGLDPAGTAGLRGGPLGGFPRPRLRRGRRHDGRRGRVWARWLMTGTNTGRLRAACRPPGGPSALPGADLVRTARRGRGRGAGLLRRRRPAAPARHAGGGAARTRSARSGSARRSGPPGARAEPGAVSLTVLEASSAEAQEEVARAHPRHRGEPDGAARVPERPARHRRPADVHDLGLGDARRTWRACADRPHADATQAGSSAATSRRRPDGRLDAPPAQRHVGALRRTAARWSQAATAAARRGTSCPRRPPTGSGRPPASGGAPAPSARPRRAARRRAAPPPAPAPRPRGPPAASSPPPRAPCGAGRRRPRARAPARRRAAPTGTPTTVRSKKTCSVRVGVKARKSCCPTSSAAAAARRSVVERRRVVEHPPGAQRRRRPGEDPVLVAAGDRVAAGVEARRGVGDRADGEVAGQQAVQPAQDAGGGAGRCRWATLATWPDAWTPASVRPATVTSAGSRRSVRRASRSTPSTVRSPGWEAQPENRDPSYSRSRRRTRPPGGHWPRGGHRDVLGQLQQHHRRRVTLARAELQGAGVAALDVGERGPDHVEEVVGDVLVAQERDRLAPRVQGVLLGEGDRLLRDAARQLGLGGRRLDAPVRQQGRREVRAHRRAVRRGAVELGSGVAVAHDRSPGGEERVLGARYSSSLRRPRPCAARFSLTSSMLFFPKFGMAESSDSVFEMRSPIVSTPTRLRQL